MPKAKQIELLNYVAATGSNRKLQVTLNGVSRVKCNKMYNRFNVSLKDGQMCAGGEEGFDSCRGIALYFDCFVDDQ